MTRSPGFVFVASLFALGCTPAAPADSGPVVDSGSSQDSAAPPDTGPDLCAAPAKGAVSLPVDDAAHDEAIEWWYWTGHLQADDGRWFGFEQVFFQFAMGTSDFAMAHHAVLDVDADIFAKSMTFEGATYSEAENGYALALGALTASGGDGQDTLHGEVEDYALDLTLSDSKTPVLHHGTGYVDYDFGGHTYYYSRSRMAAEGTLQVGDESLAVTGSGWFDHQWGLLGSAVNSGWDWFALQLDDGSEVMIYVIRSGGTASLVGGTHFSADCETTEIAPEDFALTALGEWTSPTSGCTWPMGWELQVGDATYTVSPIREDQEMYNAMMPYWEGAAMVSGSGTGRAYVELTGYCS